MDRYQVMVGLSRNPENYTEEYGKQLQLFEALVRLPKQPEKVLRQTLALLLAYPRVDERLPIVLIGNIKAVKCYKIRNIILNSLFVLKYKRLVSSEQLLENLLDHCADLRSVLKKTRKEVGEETIPCLLKYYRNGTDKQRCFCYYLMVYLFSRGHSQLEDEVCGGLFVDGKVGKMCTLYFLDQIDFEGEKSDEAMSLLSEDGVRFGKLLFKEISSKKMEREQKVAKMKVYVLFRARYGLKASVVPMAMNMLDTEKEDVKDLIRIIVGSVTSRDVLKVIEIVSDVLCSEFRDDDFIVYGLNILREIYCKFDPEVGRPVERSESDDEYIEQSEAEEDVEGDVKGDTALEEIKDKILNRVECFRGSKVKSVRYAYCSVVNAIRNKKRLNRPPEFVRRKSTKEEREASRKTGRVVKEKQKYSGGKHSKRRKVGRTRASKLK